MNDSTIKFYQHGRMAARQIDELIGICKGAILDGAVSEAEARYLLQWLETNRECADTWPASVLYPRLSDMFRDHLLDDEEATELLELLADLAGGTPTKAGNAPTALPLDTPAPDIIWRDRRFCVTGTFTFGPRSKVIRAIEESGGEMLSGIRKDLDYLIIGSIGTESWKHSSFGTKIIKAMEYKSAGRPIHIVSEAHWLEFI